MVSIPEDGGPPHPGEVLRENFLKPGGLSQRELAEGIEVPYQRVNELVNGRRGITPSTALRLGKFLGTTSEYWLGAQGRWELYRARRREAAVLDRIRRYRPLRKATELVRGSLEPRK